MTYSSKNRQSLPVVPKIYSNTDRGWSFIVRCYQLSTLICDNVIIKGYFLNYRILCYRTSAFDMVPDYRNESLLFHQHVITTNTYLLQYPKIKK